MQLSDYDYCLLKNISSIIMYSASLVCAVYFSSYKEDIALCELMTFAFVHLSSPKDHRVSYLLF